MNEEKNIVKKDVFSASSRETAAAFAMYIAAFIYIESGFADADQWKVFFSVFVLMFIAITEYICYGRKRTAESCVWLCCMLIITVCSVFEIGQVWQRGASAFFVHIFAVWWVLSRGGRLLEGESGHLLPFDCLNGFAVFPFGNFMLRIKCVLSFISKRKCKSDRKTNIPAVAGALSVGAFLLYLSAKALTAADENFGTLINGFLDAFRFEFNEDYLLRFVMSLPVGAWLFALIAGSLRTDRDKLDARAEAVNAALDRFHFVPSTVWKILMAAFSLLYLAFFAMQSSYLFGAFVRKLPEGFIVSRYARQGFFELCTVIAINYVLLWLVLRTGSRSEKRDTAEKIMCTVLLAAGVLFTVVALSKLFLYISCFGFTPKRLQSTWLAIVMGCGCMASIYSLWSGKKTFKLWMMFGAVTLALLHFV